MVPTLWAVKIRRRAVHLRVLQVLQLQLHHRVRQRVPLEHRHRVAHAGTGLHHQPARAPGRVQREDRAVGERLLEPRVERLLGAAGAGAGGAGTGDRAERGDLELIN